MLAVAKDLYRREGSSGFLRGLPARLWKISLGQAIIFGSYEHVSAALKAALEQEQ